jgi:P27 family predicted phage terminase small subunit
MGLRGPRAKPTNLKILQGTYRKDRAAPNEPRPEVAVPQSPPHLNDLAKKEWRRIAPELLKHGLLTKLDRAALAAYCQSWALWVEAEEKLKTEGLMVKMPSGYEQQSIWLSISKTALTQMRAFASEFGLSPATRTRVSAVEPPRQPSKLDRYLKPTEKSPWDEIMEEDEKEERFFGRS